MHQLSRFPLQGRHAQTDCYQCHKSASLLLFDPMGTVCADCHMKDYNSATKPSHLASKYPNDCFFCHTESSWQPAKFNHSTTTFPLTGGHIGVDCISCHSKGYTAISTVCSSCHTAIFNSTTNPSHLAAKFSNDCKSCHTEIAWKPSSYNHNTATTFPLNGGHVGVVCISCHASGYTGISSECVSCHLTNYNTTTNPSHLVLKYSTDCKICHNVSAWVPSTFNHNTSTAFPLTGAHIGVACNACHTNGYAGISATCVSCHLTRYNATTNPGHVAAKFSTDCATCHSSTAWSPATFNHTTGTTFPLTGAHVGVTCISCHAAGYVGISTACVSCHLTNYNASINPPHLSGKFSTDCKTCHTVTAWSPATFNHTTSTTYPLTGAHTGVACISCHSAGYAGIPTTCVSCHLAVYNSTNNPAHAAAKFPTTCETCHTVTVWTTSTYNHDTQYFRINSGKHNGQWTLCSECHTNASNFAIFSCLLCHAHAQASMDSAHKGKSGYVYNSANCFSCHPKV